jgi:membrane-bound serine protease (ClpP class)
VAVALGATIMFDTEVPEFRISWAAAAGFGVASFAVVLVLARVALSSRRATIVSGREQMIGETGEVIDWSRGQGHVHVHGERWRARSVDELDAGEAVEVRDINGLTLTVGRATSAEASDFKA